MINLSRLYNMVNADAAKNDLFTYGYFANTMGDLRKATDLGKTILNVVYSRLDAILDESEERRFCTKNGNFVLFYSLDSFLNEKRY